jgi:hypothetical protein
MHLAERVDKKTGTNWNRDQPGARRQPLHCLLRGGTGTPVVLDEGVNRSVPGGGKRGAARLCESGCIVSTLPAASNASAASRSHLSPIQVRLLRCDRSLAFVTRTGDAP